MKLRNVIVLPALLLLLAATVLYSQTRKGENKNRTETSYYPSGKPKLELVYDEQQQLQRTVTYYESGHIESDCAFKDGPCTRFYENGDTLMYTFKRQGIPEGRAFFYYQGSEPGSEQFYKDGFKSGTWRYYNEDGSLREEAVYNGQMSPANSSDFSDNKYYYHNRLAFTVAIRDNKGTDTLILDKEAFEALMPKEKPNGKALFQSNCAMCHSLSKDATGPMMKGVVKNRKKEWLIRMITNAPQLIEEEDKEAVALYYKWNKTAHPDYTETLSREQVLLIIDYLKTAN